MKKIALYAIGAALLGASAVAAQPYPDQRDNGPPGQQQKYQRQDQGPPGQGMGPQDQRRGDDYRGRGDDHRDRGRGDDHRHDNDRGRWGDRDGFDREWGARGARWDRDWRRGDHLPRGYWTDRRYIIDDYRYYRLPPPRYGYHWVRYADRFVLVRDRDGFVDRIIRDLLR
jgi:Ni/Co efflux regulator RcnB